MSGKVALGMSVRAVAAGGGVDGFLVPYPSHVTPNLVQRLQQGFPSSHLTRRILMRGRRQR